MQASSKSSRLRSLEVLNDEIFHHYSRRDSKLVKRVVIPEVLDYKLMLVGQAPGGVTQRFSGIPYVKPGRGRRLSPTGQKLNGFLLQFGYTIDPGDRGHQYAYVTDVAHYYPGRSWAVVR
jgi:uracil-DNA glycosylase